MNARRGRKRTRQEGQSRQSAREVRESLGDTQACRLTQSAAGFTLIEGMIITLIVSILAAIAVPNFIAYRDKSRLSSVQATAKQIQDALANYAMDDNTGDFPPTAAMANWLALRTLVQPYSGLYPANPADMGIQSITYTSPSPTTYTLQIVTIVSANAPVDTIVVTPQGITKQ